MDDPYIDNMVLVHAGLYASLTETYIGELFHSTIDSIMIEFLENM